MPGLTIRNRGRWREWVLALATASWTMAQAFQQPPITTAPPDPAAPSVKPSGGPAANAAPPPSAPAKRTAAELEKLVAPIALYPDPLLATLLPASVYPLEIVQAARFVSNTNNLATLDAQPWDSNVKAVARVPAVIQKMNDDLSWMIELGEAFLAQDKDLMDAIQAMRDKAQKAGTLRTTPQQVVVVTNSVVEKTVEQQVVVVTNTVVQIQPASSSVVYVPTYNPYTVYYPPPAYVYDPYAPLVGFAAGVAMGAIIANNCDWYHGGCYHGDVNVDIDRNVNRNVDRDGRGNVARPTASGQTAGRGAQQKWQPDQSRLSKSGPPSASTSARSMEARGWGTAGGGTRPSTGISQANRPTPASGANRPSASPRVSPSSSSPSASRSSSGSAFGGTSSGSSARDFSTRGSSSRSGGGGFGGGGGRGGGGGGRGGRR